MSEDTPERDSHSFSGINHLLEEHDPENKRVISDAFSQGFIEQGKNDQDDIISLPANGLLHPNYNYGSFFCGDSELGEMPPSIHSYVSESDQDERNEQTVLMHSHKESAIPSRERITNRNKARKQPAAAEKQDDEWVQEKKKKMPKKSHNKLSKKPKQDESPLIENSCKCKKSQCRTSNCHCFLRGKACGVSCACVSCQNKMGESSVQQSGERSNWKSKLKEKDSEWIEEWISETKRKEEDGPYGKKKNAAKEIKEPREGYCSCKKSHCLKKYCECFNHGKPCGTLCRCEGCQNISQDVVID